MPVICASECATKPMVVGSRMGSEGGRGKEEVEHVFVLLALLSSSLTGCPTFYGRNFPTFFSQRRNLCPNSRESAIFRRRKSGVQPLQ